MKFLLPALLAALGLTAAAWSQETTFKVDVSLVNLLVNVRDARGAPIADLRAEDFKILDDGVPRDIAVFERQTNRPLSIALMIDASLSTAKELKFEREAARRFLKNLLRAGDGVRDRAAVFQFSDYVDLLVGFTSSLERLSRALGRIRAVSGTSLYDAILLASQQLERRRGRRVMVIITDGGDTTSRITFHEALEAVHDIDAVIYGVVVIPVRSDAGRNVGGENALKSLASGTGGETFVQYGTDDLDQVFSQILRNLRTQYLIGYYPPPIPSDTQRFRRTEVKVNRPGARILARDGYFVPEEAERKTPTGKISIRPRPGSSAETLPPVEAKPPRPETHKLTGNLP